MRAQRHKIQRQIIEISVADRATGQRLHEELSRIQREIIEPLLDKCCSELSAPDRVHRIPRLELDLGAVSLDELEKELVEKLESALREALGAKILEEEQISQMLGEDPSAMARAELISLFARTGTLPFWADSSEPRVVDEAVAELLARDMPMFIAMIRELARDARALRRLVRHVKPERLRALLEALVQAPMPAGAERAAEVWELLAMGTMSSVSIPHAVLWVAAIETALRGESPSGEGGPFIAEVLGRVALETGSAYRSMVLGLFEASGARHGTRTRGVGRVLAELAAELGEKMPGTSGGRRDEPKAPGTFGDGTSGEKVSAQKVSDQNIFGQKVPTTFEKSESDNNAKVPTTFEKGAPEHTSKVPGTFGVSELDNNERVPGTFEKGAPEHTSKVPGTFGMSELDNNEKVPTTFGVSELGNNEKVPTTFADGVRDGGREVPGTFDTSDLRNNKRVPADQEVPTTFEGGATGHPSKVPTTFEGGAGGSSKVPTTFEGGAIGHPSKVPTTFEHAPKVPTTSEKSDPSHLSKVPTTFEGGAPDHASKVPATFGKSDPTNTQKVPTTFQKGAADNIQKVPTTSEPARRGPSATTQSPKPPPRERSSNLHEDPEQIYLDTSGLALVWPFLATYFERLDLLAHKKSFRDEPARARAVLLLQYLATTDPEPPEYRLPLAKVLCGMPFDDLFFPGPELTDIEIGEGASLLSAVLQHAKIFGEISPNDFRTAFLVRRGILSTRDGAWLLRVERAPYDLILQQLPWPLSWIRLPWMQAPLYVEWIR